MGNTKGNVLLSYDVDSKHTQVLNALSNIGYLTSWRNSDAGPVYQMPNTTVWHVSTTSTQAITDIKTVCKQVGCKLEKAVAVKATEFEGV